MFSGGRFLVVQLCVRIVRTRQEYLILIHRRPALPFPPEQSMGATSTRSREAPTANEAKTPARALYVPSDFSTAVNCAVHPLYRPIRL